MTEKLLQYIWHQQYFNKEHLQTEGFASQPVQVLAPRQVCSVSVSVSES